MTKEMEIAISSLANNTDFSYMLEEERYPKHIEKDMSDGEILIMLIKRAYESGYSDGRY